MVRTKKVKFSQLKQGMSIVSEDSGGVGTVMQDPGVLFVYNEDVAQRVCPPEFISNPEGAGSWANMDSAVWVVLVSWNSNASPVYIAGYPNDEVTVEVEFTVKPLGVKE